MILFGTESSIMNLRKVQKQKKSLIKNLSQETKILALFLCKFIIVNILLLCVFLM